MFSTLTLQVLYVACICYAQTGKTLNERKKRPERVVAGLNNHNALWHVKKCHDAKFVSWLLEKTTTMRCGIMELPERVVVVSFYSHDKM
jgi:hypothetical protein